jgi:hypothetical protein
MVDENKTGQGLGDIVRKIQKDVVPFQEKGDHGNFARGTSEVERSGAVLQRK